MTDCKNKLFQIAPTPVEERLPSRGDFDDEGLCWWWRTDGLEEIWEQLVWDFDVLNYNTRSPHVKYTHWLPHWAIPAPATPGLADPKDLRELALDAVNALRYIEGSYGSLYGVGWERVFSKADKLFGKP